MDKAAENKLKTLLGKVRDKIGEVKRSIYYGQNHVICKGQEAFDRVMDWLGRSGWVGFKSRSL